MDKKISEFLSQTAIPADAELTYISGGTNYRIPLTDFLASVGVSGTIEQAGDPLATPVLNKAGSVNEIRNLEDGSGVKSTVSPQNGITLEHNFQEDTAGATLFRDLSALSPLARSIVAGPGINVAGSNGEIQISTTDTPVSTKTIVVGSISDFPPAVGGVITLADNTEYLLVNDVTTGDRFVLGNNTVIADSSALLNALTYTGTETMFTSVNNNFVVKEIKILCPNGTLVDATGTGTEIVVLLSVDVQADIGGTMGNLLGIYSDNVTMQLVTNGFTYTGSNGIFLGEATLATIEAGIMHDLGTSTFNGFSAVTSFLTLNGTSIGFSGLVDSGNINPGNLGTIANCRFYGPGTPLQNISESDIRWSMALNDSIPDTDKLAMASLTGNATETVISVVSTPVKIAGTWVDQVSSQFTADATGRITYTGGGVISANIDATLSAQPVSGNTKDVSFYIALNGVVVSPAMSNTITSGVTSNTSVVWYVLLTQGDFLEVFAANDDDTVNIIAENAVFRVH